MTFIQDQSYALLGAGLLARHGDPCPGEMSGLIEGVHQVFDGRLATDCSQPLALALSGVGELGRPGLSMAADWAGVHGRRLLYLTVDRRPQSGEPGLDRGVQGPCREAGRKNFRPLEWTGPKPSTGLPAAARLARHRLLAEAPPAGRGQCHADGSCRQRSGSVRRHATGRFNDAGRQAWSPSRRSGRRGGASSFCAPCSGPAAATCAPG